MKTNEFIKLIEENKEKGFSKLYNEYYALVYNTIFKIVRNREVTEDLASDVFVKVYQKISLFKENISLEMWIKTIAINTAIDFIRKMRKEETNLYVDNEENKIILDDTDKKTPESILIENEHKDIMYDAIDSLGDRTKQVLLLRLIDNMSYKDIAKEMNISLGTVKHTLHKYKKQIKNSINQQKIRKNGTKKSILFDGNKILS